MLVSPVFTGPLDAKMAAGGGLWKGCQGAQSTLEGSQARSPEACQASHGL